MLTKGVRLKQFKQKGGRTPSNSPADRKLLKNNNNNFSEQSSREESPVTTGNSTTTHTIINHSANTDEVMHNSYDNSHSPENHIDNSIQERLSPNPIANSPSFRAVSPYSGAERTTASTESIQQLSRQINGLLAESQQFDVNNDSENSNIAELEQRNRELAALLENHTQTNQQLTLQVQQTKDYSAHLQEQLEREREHFDERSKKEVGSLKEQLQVHIQTIGILVAEKTELQSQLNQAQKIAEARFDEIDELSSRLKASRQRVADLEKNLSSKSNSSQQFEKSSREYAKDVDKYKLELYKSNKQIEELQHQSSELQQKLDFKISQCNTLEQSTAELQSRLEMAELYTQQLSNQSETSKESLAIVDQLQKEKQELVQKVQEYTENLQKVSQDRDQLSDHYQQYADQFKLQTQQLTGQVSSLTEEREKLITRQHDLESAVLELQNKLLDVANDQTPSAATTELQTELDKLHADYNNLSQRHESQIHDNAQLSRLLEEKESKLYDLESRVEIMGEEVGDKAQLLENIQSDKTALSRAIAQNKELKTQLSELQNGFVKMSNDNMEIVTRLQTEEHRSHELAGKLCQQEEEMKTLRESLSKKEDALSTLQKETDDVKKEEFQKDQIQDRLRHYEAHAQLADTLQRELTASQDMIDALTTQNSELRTMLLKASENTVPPQSEEEKLEREKRDDLVDSLTSAIKQLESERNQLIDNLKEQRNYSDEMSVKVADLEQEIIRRGTSMTDNDKIGKWEYEQLKSAMDKVQDKYTKVMRDKADLSDKADQLEHLVLQLQGETDTIDTKTKHGLEPWFDYRPEVVGEYISLYHHQRALLQQREFQKNDYIEQLALDREEMQGKMSELQTLVMQLLGEKHMLSSYHEAQQPISDLQAKLSAMPHQHHTHSHRLRQAKGNEGVPNAEEWPDYTSSESEIESEVEAIVGGKDITLTPTPSPPQSQGTITPCEESPNQNIPQRTNTADKILHLLTEIGQANMTDTTFVTEKYFHPCKYCKGKLQIL